MGENIVLSDVDVDSAILSVSDSIYDCFCTWLPLTNMPYNFETNECYLFLAA